MHICASILFSANNKCWLAEDGAAIHQALQKLVERRTVPQVFVNGVHVGGADDTVAAQHSGRLKKLLKSRQAKSIPVDRSHDSEL
jgi:glutaredoxin-related protein